MIVPVPMAAMRVLLAEDDETKAVQTQSMLREAEDTEVVVDWVSSSTEALRHTTRGGYDAYLIDVTLGDASGLDVLQQAIEAGCHAPIVLLAEYGEGGQDTEALRLGAADFLVKGETTAPQLRRAVHARDRARPRLARAPRERGAPAAGRAHREPRPPRRRHRPRLQQPADRHPGLHDHARAADRSPTIRRANRSTRSAGPPSWPRGWRGSCSPTAGGRSIEPTEIDLNRVVEGLAEMLERLVGDHLTFDVATTRPLPLVVADRSQMEQVVMNLVLNARDATPPGGRITDPHRDADHRRGRGRSRAPRRRRRVRLGVGRGHRLRHVERGDGARLRAVLHHQAEGQRHRPRPGHAPTAASPRAAASCASAASSASARR